MPSPCWPELIPQLHSTAREAPEEEGTLNVGEQSLLLSGRRPDFLSFNFEVPAITLSGRC